MSINECLYIYIYKFCIQNFLPKRVCILLSCGIMTFTAFYTNVWQCVCREYGVISYELTHTRVTAANSILSKSCDDTAFWWVFGDVLIILLRSAPREKIIFKYKEILIINWLTFVCTHGYPCVSCLYVWLYIWVFIKQQVLHLKIFFSQLQNKNI